MQPEYLMNHPFGFFRELLKQPVWVTIWVGMLMAVNLSSLAFWSDPTAKIIMAVFLLSSMLMMGLYVALGFQRILGLGHVLWIPLLGYLLVRLQSSTGPFAGYLLVLSVCLGISLLFDIRDVWLYARSDNRDAGSPSDGSHQ